MDHASAPRSDAHSAVRTGWIRRRITRAALISLGLLLLQPVHGRVLTDPVASDVTTRALSVVWVVSEAVVGAEVRLYADAEGINEILDPGVQQVLVGSDAAPNRAAQLALENGVIKVNVTGLDPDTTYYVETIAELAGGGIETAPAGTAPLVAVRTAVATVKEAASASIIVNDVLVYDALMPDGQTPAEGSIVLLSAQADSPYPVSAFVGDGAEPHQALFDLNNLYGFDGLSLDVEANTRLRIRTLRGLNCFGELDDHEVAVNRRAPPHEESPPVTQLESPANCFSPGGNNVDHDCDGRIGVGDVTAVVSRFGTNGGTCRFNATLDANVDGRIGVVDVTSVVTVFRQVEP